MTEAHAESIIGLLLGVKNKQNPTAEATKINSAGQEVTTARHINTRKRKPVKESS